MNFYGITYWNKKKSVLVDKELASTFSCTKKKSSVIQSAPLAFPQRSITRPKICEPQAKPAVGHGTLVIFNNMLAFLCKKFPTSDLGTLKRSWLVIFSCEMPHRKFKKQSKIHKQKTQTKTNKKKILLQASKKCFANSLFT